MSTAPTRREYLIAGGANK